ncbi:hypothetical protein, partial [Sideroxydans sp. CL21]
GQHHQQRTLPTGLLSAGANRIYPFYADVPDLAAIPVCGHQHQDAQADCQIASL